MPPTRVLVVDDSPTVRAHLVETLRADPELRVVGEAADGLAALDACRRLRPDVVTMDVTMPVMNGLEATERIMAYSPTPILVVSSAIRRDEARASCEALAVGAVDVFAKPEATDDLADWERRLRAAVKMTARIKVVTLPRGRLRPAREGSVAPAETSRDERGTWRGAGIGKQQEYVVIGASTGGPSALATVLGALPPDFPLPILVVVHISPAFAESFVDWLARRGRLPVRTAIDGAATPRFGEPGVWLAPANRHLRIEAERIRLSDAPEIHGCRPSVDVLFHSAAREWGPRVAAVLLSGMGRDGADGMLAIRRAGGATLAQDEASCVVFGMPGEAVRLGAVGRVVPLDQIAPALVSLIRPPQDSDPDVAPHPRRR